MPPSLPRAALPQKSQDQQKVEREEKDLNINNQTPKTNRVPQVSPLRPGIKPNAQSTDSFELKT